MRSSQRRSSDIHTMTGTMRKQSIPPARSGAQFAPWIAFVTYILFTMAINLFGPWVYPHYAWQIVVAFMLVFLLFGTLAYKLGIDRSGSSANINMKKRASGENPLAIAKFALLFSCALLFMMTIERAGLGGAPDWQADPFAAMQSAYDDTTFVPTRSYWLYSYLAAIDVIAKCLGPYYFRQLKWPFKLLVFGNYGGTLLYVIFFDGNQKTIGDMIVYLGAVLAVRFSQEQIARRRGLTRSRPRWKAMVAVAIGGVGAMYLLLKNLSTRLETWHWVPEALGQGLAVANYDHWLIQILPAQLRTGGMAAFLYLSNGYLGLSLALRMPFEWSAGMGSSIAFRDSAARILGITTASYGAPYPERMIRAFGYDGYVNWVTIFPWLASDFTFVGAIAFMCVVIYFFAMAWHRAIEFGNWISVVFVAHFGILLVYVPSNNQLFQTRTSLVATCTIFLVWMMFRNSGGPSPLLEEVR